MRLAILGAGGHGKVVADTAEACGWKEVVFFDDSWPQLTRCGVWPVLGDSACLRNTLSQFDGVVVAIGDNKTRLRITLELQASGAKIATVVHPRANISRYAEIAAGSVIFAGVSVNAGAVVGQAAILNTGCNVDHDCRLGQGCHVSPGASLAGAVVLGDLCWVGIGASIRQCIHIGSAVVIGAGAAVVANVMDNVTIVGVPARRLK